MRVAIYARVSTEDQTTDNQVPVLQKIADDRGWTVLKVYAEEASAWRAGRQAELKQLLIDASNRKYDYLIIWSLDRLSREGVGVLFNLVHTFKSYGCQVVSAQESWLEQSGPMQDLLISIFAWVAQFESARRSERIKAAMALRRKKGLWVGRKPGSKDNGKRKRTGYLLRYADRRMPDQKRVPENGT